MDRGAGVIMHISSLPGKYGIGTFGKQAYKFVDFLKASGFKYWQILPLGHTSYGDSPYQCFSAFAGNPYFIDFELLNENGLLEKWEYEHEDYGNDQSRVDYGKIYVSKYNVLKKAYNNFKNRNNQTFINELKEFKNENVEWLPDYSLYMALKHKFNFKSWTEWNDKIKKREYYEMEAYKSVLLDEIEYWNFIQYLFFKQWGNLKKYVNDKGIKIIGDIPIYVSADSSDTWSRPSNFKLDKNTLQPLVVAGCPPDSFCKTGQLWGNLIYDWDYMKKNNYEWWMKRIAQSFKLYDVIRIDHFRGFESYWQVPFGNPTAEHGRWQKGPGIDFFNAIKNKFGNVGIIAEDLGFITDEVRNLLNSTGFPGMRVLQFAFGGSNKNDYLPHRYIKNCIAYTGTHDNDTFLGWYQQSGGRHEIENAKKYLGLNGEERYNWGFLRGVWSSVADVAIAPMQDFLNLGADSRMNLPSSFGGNWSWRVTEGQLNDWLQRRIYELSKMYGRVD